MKRWMALLLVLLFSGAAQAETLPKYSTPAERARGCVYANGMENEDDVLVTVGSPTFSADGIELNGSSQAAADVLMGHEFNSDPLSVVVEFTPHFAYDGDVTYILYSTDSDDNYIAKYNDAGSNVLEIEVGGTQVAQIASATYGAYWLQNQRNVIVLSATTGTTSVFLNGTQILTDDSTAWTPTENTEFYIGCDSTQTTLFDGVIHSIKIFHAQLTDAEGTGWWETYHYENLATAHWRMRAQDHDPTNDDLTRSVAGYDELLGSVGDFESWQGSHANCTDCPTGILCDCTLGDIVQESSIVYTGSTSVEMQTAYAYVPYIIQYKTWEANKCYQVSWCYYGNDGTEDVLFGVGRLDLADTYDPSSDTWTAPITGMNITNAPASWTCESMFVNVGATEKPAGNAYGWGIMATSANGTAIYVDNVRVKEFADCLTGVSSPAKLADRHGYDFDGSNDYFQLTYTPSAFTPAGDFSAVFYGQAHTVAGGDAIVGVYKGGNNQISWLMYRYEADVIGYVSDDGTSGAGHLSSTAASATVRVGEDFVGIMTYDYVADGSSILEVDVEDQSSSITNADGPPHASSEKFMVCEHGDGSKRWDGPAYEVLYFDGLVLTGLQKEDLKHNLKARRNLP